MQILIEKLVLLSICCTPLHGSIAAKKGRFAAAKKSCNIIRREQCVQGRAGGRQAGSAYSVRPWRGSVLRIFGKYVGPVLEAFGPSPNKQTRHPGTELAAPVKWSLRFNVLVAVIAWYLVSLLFCSTGI
jgi:hypothetical protein